MSKDIVASKNKRRPHIKHYLLAIETICELCITEEKWFVSGESNVFRRSEIGLNIS